MTNSTPKKGEWKDGFLHLLGRTGNVAAACRAVGVSRVAAYRAKKRSRRFSEQWRDAEATAVDAMDAELVRRAVTGVDKPVFYKGNIVATIKKFSDHLLMFLLRSRNPRKYDPKYMQVLNTDYDEWPRHTQEYWEVLTCTGGPLEANRPMAERICRLLACGTIYALREVRELEDRMLLTPKSRVMAGLQPYPGNEKPEEPLVDYRARLGVKRN